MGRQQPGIAYGYLFIVHEEYVKIRVGWKQILVHFCMAFNPLMQFPRCYDAVWQRDFFYFYLTNMGFLRLHFRSLCHALFFQLRALLLFALAFHHQFVNGQPMRFERFDKSAGLAYNEVNTLFLDRLGYLWIGTWDGLSRYDGHRFQTWHSDPNDPGTLPFNEVLSFAEKNDGNLWIGTARGLGWFDRRTESLKGLSADPRAQCLSQTLLPRSCLLMGNNTHTLLISRPQSGHYYLFNPGNEKYSCEAQQEFRTLTATGRAGNLIFIAGEEGLTCLNDEGKQPRNASLDSLQKWIKKQNVAALSNREDEILLCATANEILAAHTDKNEFRRFPFPAGLRDSLGTITCLLQDTRGDLWLGTHSGLWKWNPYTGNRIHFLPEPANPFSLSAAHITALLEGPGKTLWVGTKGGGICKLQLQPSPFHQLPAQQLAPGAMPEVFSFIENDDHSFWLGTSLGLIPWDRNKQQTAGNPIPVPDAKGEEGTILSLAKGPENSILAGTRGKGLFQFFPQTGEWKNFNAGIPQTPVNPDPVRRLIQDPEGNLWMASASGLYRRDENAGNWFPFHEDQKENPGGAYTRHGYTWDVQKDASGYLAVATVGVDVFHAADHFHSQLLDFAPGLEKDSRKNSALCVFALGRGKFLAGTYGNGVFWLDAINKKLNRFTSREGLPNDCVYGIEGDAQNGYWMSTNAGIACLDLPSGQIRAFGKPDGLWMEEYETGSHYKDESGAIWFGGNQGAVWFRPAEVMAVKADELRTPLVSAVAVNGMFFSAGSCIADEKQIKIPPRVNQLALYLFSPDMDRASVLRYHYRLLPAEEDWNRLDPDLPAVYTQLSPGTYTFEVKALSPQGQSSPVRQLVLHIQPAWFQTTLFRYGGSALLLLLVFVLIRTRIRRVRENERRIVMQKARDLDLQLLKMRMDHHFTFNSLNSIQHFLQKHDAASAQEYLARFGKLLREALQLTGKRFHLLAEEEELLRLYLDLEALRADGAFTWEIRRDPALDEWNVQVPPLLVQPLIENAIWHGLMPKKSGGKLEIEINQIENNIEWVVRDNGTGRKASQQLKASSTLKKDSAGIRLVEETLALLAQEGIPGGMETRDLYHPDGTAAGTEVRVHFQIPD